MANFIGQWQKDYQIATGNSGTVEDVFGRLGRFGGLAIWVEVDEDGKTVFYSPYLNSSPGDGEHAEISRDDGIWRNEATGRFCAGPCDCDLCQFETDETAWIDGMTGATDWSEWEWHKSDSILEY